MNDDFLKGLNFKDDMDLIDVLNIAVEKAQETGLPVREAFTMICTYWYDRD